MSTKAKHEDEKTTEAKTEKPPAKSDVQAALDLFANDRGEHDWLFERQEAKKFYVASSAGALVDPKSRKPILFDDVNDAQALAIAISTERPNDGVQALPIF